MKRLKRVFMYNEKELPEILGSPEANLLHYSNIYPELVNANILGPEIKEEKAVYEFKSKTGTKG